MLEPQWWIDLVDETLKELFYEVKRDAEANDTTHEGVVYLPVGDLTCWGRDPGTEPDEIPRLCEGWFDHEDYEGDHTYALVRWERDEDEDVDNRTACWKVWLNISYDPSDREKALILYEEACEHAAEAQRDREW